jgi:hypothetical protein
MFRIELDHTEWQAILNIIGRQPYADVAQLIARMSQQLQGGPVGQQAPQPRPAGNGEQMKEVPRDNQS